MQIPSGSIVTACVLAVLLLVAGCAGGATETRVSRDVLLQPVDARGPDPFTDSTATGPGLPPPVTRTAVPAMPAADTRTASAPPSAARSLSGGTPGLYGGTAGVASCDVEREIGYLTADPAKGRAFAQAEGVEEAFLPGYLRGLTPVALRADTRVTNHGYRTGRAAGFQSVLQAGTAVLVDARGVPRVRCACGNPLLPPDLARDDAGTSGSPWSGYRAADVIVVTPAPRDVTGITILDLETRIWIERRVGQDVGQDRPVAPPPGETQHPPTAPPVPPDTASSASAGGTTTDCDTPPTLPRTTPIPTAPAVSVTPATGDEAAPVRPTTPLTDCASTTDCGTAPPAAPAVTAAPAMAEAAPPARPAVQPADCATTTVPTDTTPPGSTVSEGTPADRPTGTPSPAPPPQSATPDATRIDPGTAPGKPHRPDTATPIPDTHPAVDSIFDSPTDVFGG
ncbi:hypothetical protein GCM10010121_006150 [Streptomyces brasiliensis]|uniref:DUF6777 domain-containing protein n=1 Tax=Streptomyces brasiliensis TaxID=1954 RepID=A0A917NG28_9ACTN|nr:hypothetical protein GCM10010121_006150 [Streptomyces brasiliensis]